MAIDYTQQKLWEAVRGLMGTGTMQERLRAVSNLIAIAASLEPAFPAYPALEERIKRVRARLSSKAPELSDEEAEEVATEILALLCEATRIARIPVGVEDTIVPNKKDIQ